MLYLHLYMKIVKLNAIDSTNSYLKKLAGSEELESWTVVWAESQTHGKGQRDNIWHSESGKNLTFSVLIRFENFDVAQQHYLNYISSLAIYNVLKFYIPDKLAVKWPNDILSAQSKIGGILTECTLKKNKVTEAIIGIGLNVNQTEFQENIVNATSLKLRRNISFDLAELLEKILLELQFQSLEIQQKRFANIKERYEAVLYKKGIPSMFIDDSDNQFLGKIQGVSQAGKLIVELEDERQKSFNFKEIRFS